MASTKNEKTKYTNMYVVEAKAKSKKIINKKLPIKIKKQTHNLLSFTTLRSEHFFTKFFHGIRKFCCDKKSPSTPHKQMAICVLQLLQ